MNFYLFLNNSMLEYRKNCGLNKTESEHNYAFIEVKMVGWP